MIIKLKDRLGEVFYLNTELVEAIIERKGNTSEIRLTTGRYFTSTYSPEKVAQLINQSRDEE